MDYETALNQEQLDIVLHGDGPVLVVAGPGSGKTRTLVYRVCRILEQGREPERVLLLTFTNRAAKEMKTRAESLIGHRAEKIVAGTFHHFANLLLRKHASALGMSQNYTILDEEDSHALLKAIILADNEKVKKGVVEDIARAISLSKLRMIPLYELLAEPDFHSLSSAPDEIEKIAQNYENAKKARNVMDFDDLLVRCNELLGDERIGTIYRDRFSDILVDEFQDTDRLQAEIIRKLYRTGSNFMVVGDDSQSIYSFRGAEIRNILGFREEYNARTFYLVRNYRSTKPIVSMINKTMERSNVRLEKTLRAIDESGILPTLQEFPDKVEEARAVADIVEKGMSNGTRYGILFRAVYLASELEVELARRGIEYDLRGGMKFFEQKHVKDMVSLLRVFHNPRDSTAAKRLFMLFPRIGEKGAERAAAELHDAADATSWLGRAGKGAHFSSLLSEIYTSGGNAAAMLDRFYGLFYKKYMEECFDDSDERKADVEALVGAATRYQSVGDFLEAFSLDAATPERRDHQVVLSTIHQAKGLEWDVVFVIGLADGLLPLSRSSDIEEERRLFYVAASRAKRELHMSYPRSSGRFYDYEELGPSRFLLELPGDCYSRRFGKE